MNTLVEKWFKSPYSWVISQLTQPRVANQQKKKKKKNLSYTYILLLLSRSYSVLVQ